MTKSIKARKLKDVERIVGVMVSVMVFNSTFNNISVIL